MVYCLNGKGLSFDAALLAGVIFRCSLVDSWVTEGSCCLMGGTLVPCCLQKEDGAHTTLASLSWPSVLLQSEMCVSFHYPFYPE